MATRAHLEIFDRDGGVCTYCGSTLERNGPRRSSDLREMRGVWQMDHVLPQRHGGSDSPDNLVLACQQCNLVKGRSLLADWDPASAALPAGVEEWLEEQAAEDERALTLLAHVERLALDIAMRAAPGRVAVLAEWAALTDSGRSAGPPLHAFVAARATVPMLIHSALHERDNRQHLLRACGAAQRIAVVCTCAEFVGELCEWCGPLDLSFPSPRHSI